ncbi:hypothetical protein [Psychromonas aquimarina]|uniref:hypothetical protein n=1 Tax=Psychromonas aquimarina TaxID=444919 RepID=UPI00048D33A9|nr:hypothetical protein [Psychromonas aquimarina]
MDIVNKSEYLSLLKSYEVECINQLEYEFHITRSFPARSLLEKRIVGKKKIIKELNERLEDVNSLSTIYDL